VASDLSDTTFRISNPVNAVESGPVADFGWVRFPQSGGARGSIHYSVRPRPVSGSRSSMSRPGSRGSGGGCLRSWRYEAQWECSRRPAGVYFVRFEPAAPVRRRVVLLPLRRDPDFARFPAPGHACRPVGRPAAAICTEVPELAPAGLKCLDGQEWSLDLSGALV